MDPNKIVELFKKWGIRPNPTYYLRDETETQTSCACALGIQLVEKFGGAAACPVKCKHGHLDALAESLGTTEAFVCGFSNGFADAKIYHSENYVDDLVDFETGHQEGWACRQALIEAGMMDPTA